MSEKIFLTRNQLAKFLPTPEAIKAFENLFKIATQQTPNNIDEVQISAESALSMANYSLSVLDNVSKLIEALELQPPEIPTINECEYLEIIKEPDWNFIKNHPTTISGYGIIDAYSAVVADAPLTGNGTTSSHLSIPAATSLANGYLSNTDWSTFNNKQTAYTNLTNIGSLANNSGWLHNDGSGVFAYSTPTKSDVGLSNVTNNAQVTSVSGTSPINSSGGTTPAISIDKSDATHNGYLSSTDWSTFNSKEPAQTKGSITEATSSVLTITNGSSSTVGPNVTIQVKQATNAVSGYLSSTDWTTFNGKQAAYTNLTSIGGLANSSGWLKNNGSGTFSYSTPTATDVGLGNVTNNAQVTSVTGTAPIVSSGGTTPAISIDKADSTHNGYLSSTDWSTFNNKQALLVSGTNIKSINNSSILDSGNLDLVAKVSSTDNAIVRFDGTSGAVQNSSVVIDDSGNVGINTSSPSAKLEVESGNIRINNPQPPNTTGTESVMLLGSQRFDGSFDRGIAGIYHFVPTTSNWGQAGGLIFKTSENDVAATERMRIDSSGNVGIGTSSPGISKLEVKGGNVYNTTSTATGTTGFVVYNGTNVGAAISCDFSGPYTYYDFRNLVVFRDTNASYAERMRIDSSGNVGIGTSSPSYQLHLSSDSAAKPSTNTWTISSDERLKENIELADLDRCYEIVKTIPLKRYTWKDSVYTQEQVSDRSKLGWIANDVQTVFPKAVNTHSQQLATFKIELKDVEEQKLISEAIVGQEEIKDEDGNIIQEFIEAKEAVYETITVQKEEKVYDVLDDCLDLNSDQIYAVMYGAIQKLQAKIEALEMTKQS